MPKAMNVTTKTMKLINKNIGSNCKNQTQSIIKMTLSIKPTIKEFITNEKTIKLIGNTIKKGTYSREYKPQSIRKKCLRFWNFVAGLQL